MVKIRLRRVGAKKQPSYRVVVADSRAPRDGRFIETIGHYNPRTDPPTVFIKEDRALYWLSVGAQPSEAVGRFLNQIGLYDKVGQVHAGAEIADLTEGRVKVSGPEAKPKAAPPTTKEKVVEAVEKVEEVVEEAVEAVAEVAEAAVEEVKEAGAEAAESVEAVVEAVTEDAAEALEEIKLEALELTARVAKALEAAKVLTAQQLGGLLAEGEEKLLALDGIGPKAVEEIREKLAGHGLGPGA